MQLRIGAVFVSAFDMLNAGSVFLKVANLKFGYFLVEQFSMGFL